MRFFGTIMIPAAIFFLTGCQTGATGLKLPTLALLNPQTQSFNDTHFKMESCEITPERTAICKLTVTNQYRDKKFEIDRRITIQDNTGTDYTVTAGGFGDSSLRPQWNQTAVADSSYQLSVIATNLSTRAASIRAVIFTRLLVRSLQGPTIGYRDQVVFSNPAMVVSGDSAPSAPPGPSATAQPSATPATTFGGDAWHWLGYWNYDGTDGQHLAANGLVLRPVSGVGFGQQWPAHLELKNHAALSARNRNLWPVQINTKQRKVCANYPGYPSYSTFIDMPGDTEDGIYLVAMCSGE